MIYKIVSAMEKYAQSIYEHEPYNNNKRKQP